MEGQRQHFTPDASLSFIQREGVAGWNAHAFRYGWFQYRSPPCHSSRRCRTAACSSNVAQTDSPPSRATSCRPSAVQSASPQKCGVAETHRMRYIGTCLSSMRTKIDTTEHSLREINEGCGQSRGETPPPGFCCRNPEVSGMRGRISRGVAWLCRQRVVNGSLVSPPTPDRVGSPVCLGFGQHRVARADTLPIPKHDVET